MIGNGHNNKEGRGHMEQCVDDIEGIVYLDHDGFIDTDYYIEASIKIMDEAAMERGQNPRQINTNDAFALYRRVYNALFRPEHRKLATADGGAARFLPGCNVTYNTENLLRLMNIYRALCIEYDSLPSVDGLTLLTGVDMASYEKYVTGARQFVQNIRKDNIQNKLQSFPIGVVTLANNDIDTGLCYTRQNIADKATVNKALSFSDLVKIGEKTGAQLSDNSSGEVDAGSGDNSKNLP